jgi:hypothetical protein
MDYAWLTNLQYPLTPGDTDFLDRLADYRIGAPQRATDRKDAYTVQELQDANIAGVYTTPYALSAIGSEALSVAVAKRQLGADYAALEGPLAKYLDADLHFLPR